MSFTRFQKTVFAVLCATCAGGSVVAMDNSTTPEDIEKIEQACNLAFNIMNNVPKDDWFEVSMIQYKVSSACLTARQFASDLEGKYPEEQWKAIKESLSNFNGVVESFESFLSEFRRNTVARIFITTKSQSDDLLDALVQMKENILFLQKGKTEGTEVKSVSERIRALSENASRVLEIVSSSTFREPMAQSENSNREQNTNALLYDTQNL